MLNRAGITLTKKNVKEYFGSLHQIAGLTNFYYMDGKANGLKAVDVRTGSGLTFKVLKDRGLDIANAEFQGVPIAWISKKLYCIT